jgi:hypothetical protein
MRYLAIYAAEREVRLIEAADVFDAKRQLGLNDVDFGAIDKHHSIVVYEYCLYEDPAKAPYWRLGSKLYAGNAFIFAHGGPETVDMDWMPDLVRKQLEFFEGGREEIEAAIAAGRVERPEARINGELVWEWPQGNDWLGRT